MPFTSVYSNIGFTPIFCLPTLEKTVDQVQKDWPELDFLAVAEITIEITIGIDCDCNVRYAYIER